MDSFLYNHPILRDRRKVLRKRATPAEKFLWTKLRRKGMRYKFVRQSSVGPYILDFYCKEKRIAIELDGGYHTEKDQMDYDKERTAYLKSLDISVLRFWNDEVFKDIDNVCQKIQRLLKKEQIPFWENKEE